MYSFLIFFHILDRCYDYCQENDLGGFLGTISPELWEDGRPMDKAVYDDWTNYNNSDPLDIQKFVKTIYDFLEVYERKYGYHFIETKKILINLVDCDMLARALEYAENMYQKYAYID